MTRHTLPHRYTTSMPVRQNYQERRIMSLPKQPTSAARWSFILERLGRHAQTILCPERQRHVSLYRHRRAWTQGILKECKVAQSERDSTSSFRSNKLQQRQTNPLWSFATMSLKVSRYTSSICVLENGYLIYRATAVM